MPDTVERVQIPLGEGVTGAEAPKQEESLIAGKFKTQEDLVKAYGELAKKLGSRTADPAKPATETPAAKLGDPLSTPAQPAAPAELDITPFQDEWDKNGKLSDESYKKLATDYRIGKAQVDEFIQARLAKVESFRNEVYQSVGGQEQFTQLMDWAKADLPPADQAAYDKALATGDPAVIRLAVAGVHAKYVNAVGKDPTLISGRPGSTGPAPYRSQAELTSAMNDKRYESDPAYRAEVAKRLEVSDLF